MSRKKVKKEVVKRKTSIYDPMGVYGRGLTENQRRGMTRRMKVENIRNPEKKLTKEDLGEYRKILEFYGMYKTVRAGHIETIPMSWDFQYAGATITNSHILLRLLNTMHITPQFFVCNTFVIERPVDVIWDSTFWYSIAVGSSEFKVFTNIAQHQSPHDDSSVTIPRYFIDGNTINYFRLFVDEDQSNMYIAQNKFDIGVGYDDFMRLPRDGTPIPYLMYPNTDLPELKINVGFDSNPGVFYKLITNITVIY